MATDYERRPITVEEFHRMYDAEIFGPDERLELLDGEIIVMPQMNPPHFASIARLTRLFVVRLGERAVLAPQLPIRLSDISEPLPDFAILHPRDDFYARERVSGLVAYALAECSDSSLRYDRGKKLRVYAKTGVAEYWIVNLRERCVEIHREAHDLGYAERIVAKPGESVAFAAFPECVFGVDDLVGPGLSEEEPSA